MAGGEGDSLLSLLRFPFTMPHNCHAAPGSRLVPDSCRFTMSLTQGCLAAGRVPPLREGKARRWGRLGPALALARLQIYAH